MRDPMPTFGSQRAPVNPARPPARAAWAADLEAVELHWTGTADPFRRFGWNAFAMRLRHARRRHLRNAVGTVNLTGAQPNRGVRIG
jgi:hypothetical protein